MGNGMKIGILAVLILALAAVLALGSRLENQPVPSTPDTRPPVTSAPTEPSTAPSTAPTEPSAPPVTQPTIPPENWETDEF